MRKHLFVLFNYNKGIFTHILLNVLDLAEKGYQVGVIFESEACKFITDFEDKGYDKFEQLKEKNLLIQKPHYAPFCPNCGPVAVDKSETDISKGGAAEILEFTVIKFTMPDGTILPAATLRPETAIEPELLSRINGSRATLRSSR